MIEVDDVGVTLGGQRVLDGATLSVDRGTLVGLVGPNGAGKTTLLRTVNGLLTPDDGAVRVAGDHVERLGSRAVSRRVATVPQDAHLGFTFSVEEIVEMGRTPHRSRLDWGHATEAVDRALERTAIDHLRTRPIDEVSGGERQRVLLARALAQDAPVLVLDEPTASLDVNHQIQVFELLRSLVADGRTVLAAIHDLDLAARYCDRLALLADGTITLVGEPWAVLGSPDLREAFETAAAVTENPLTGTPAVTALPDRPDRQQRVHVVGTGSTAARAVSACWQAGFEVSAGVVPEAGAVATVAERLDVSTATASPFESLPESVRDAAHASLDAADVVVTAGDPDPVTAERLAAFEHVIDWSPRTGPSVAEAVRAALRDEQAADDD